MIFWDTVVANCVCRYLVNHFWAETCAIQYEVIVVNGQTTTSAFHKVVQRQYWSEVAKTTVICVKFFSWCCVPEIIKIDQCIMKLFKKHKYGPLCTWPIAPPRSHSLNLVFTDILEGVFCFVASIWEGWSAYCGGNGAAIHRKVQNARQHQVHWYVAR